MSKPYKNKLIVYKGTRYFEVPDGYFVGSRPDRKILHREIWRNYNGEIPKTYHIHHIDHDKGNNNIDNLECLSPSEHSRRHQHLGRWAKTAEGKKHLARIRKEMWIDRKKYGAICTECGIKYTTVFPTRSKYCASSCRTKVSNRKKLASGGL